MWKVTLYVNGKEVDIFRWFLRRSRNQAILLSLEEALGRKLYKEGDNISYTIEEVREGENLC